MENFERVESTQNRLKEALDYAGLKQVDLARLTGIDKGSLSCYFSGRYEPKQTAVYKIAKALDVSEMWLWGYDCPKDRPPEQKENDALADLVDMLNKEKDFRQLVLKLSHLKPEQLELINNLVSALPQS